MAAGLLPGQSSDGKSLAAALIGPARYPAQDQQLFRHIRVRSYHLREDSGSLPACASKATTSRPCRRAPPEFRRAAGPGRSFRHRPYRTPTATLRVPDSLRVCRAAPRSTRLPAGARFLRSALVNRRLAYLQLRPGAGAAVSAAEAGRKALAKRAGCHSGTTHREFVVPPPYGARPHRTANSIRECPRRRRPQDGPEREASHSQLTGFGERARKTPRRLPATGSTLRASVRSAWRAAGRRLRDSRLETSDFRFSGSSRSHLRAQGPRVVSQFISLNRHAINPLADCVRIEPIRSKRSGPSSGKPFEICQV